jgi:NAD(P)-dependent dehydrogenase (short-subunit alcohol dehydrogenase family)
MPILHLTRAEGKRLTINVRRESTVVMENDHTSFTFDYEGRLIGAFLEGRNYRRSLSNEILEKQSGPRPGLSSRLRRMLRREEVERLETRAYEFARDAAAVVGANRRLAPTIEVCEALARVRGYDYARLEREREAYARVYQPVTILPPDQYLALYLQVTEGCAYNACEFCGFYRDRRFRIKSLEEFRAHILSVRAFFGGGLSLRHSIFLGDANALTISQMNLMPVFDLLNAEFAILPRDLTAPERAEWEAAHPINFNGIYSFVDAFSMHRKTPRHYADLAQRGLRRVYVGLESGEPQLLKFLGKPNQPSDVVKLVNDLKAGGVAVGVIVLVGAGGARFQEAHIRETAQVINAMPLDENDLIYFSQVVDYPGSTYSQRAAEAGILPLGSAEVEQQMVRLRAGLEFGDPARAPKVSYYDIREFVY